MSRKAFFVLIFVICVGLIFLSSGCSKKLVKQDPSTMTAEELAAEKERLAKLEAEQREQELARLREEEAKRKAEEARRREEEARRREEEARKKEQERMEFEKSLAAKRTPGIEGEVYESKLLKRVYFEFDKYEIRMSDLAILKENAAVLKKYPQVKVQIEGHCDERGTNEYNLALGERRANSTKQYLLSLGIEAERISIISYGEERPVEASHNEEAWGKNRRADFIVVSK